MKALTVWQPHASLIAVGAQRIVTPPEYTHYRGTVAIHAGTPWTLKEQLLLRPAKRALSAEPQHYQLGISIVAVKGYGENAAISFALNRHPDLSRHELRAEILRRLKQEKHFG
ncbi:MAG TPA: hypothetical protein PLD20_13025 [Blastocatellia bacterium]|nr:hypothetical protein [Blastocatellia bacterium]HMV87206.1 hypothetical protein [Blastocatellia bacterium]HMX25560.1 hypothetical protein [Blastocatellia bacterium]HMY70294.1 hypothetical protein [Blastocatellia bacterium]HMZ18851.1 hypothetical protein [Blastocatellia bacterium]